jgi:uncharacterized protein (TIGR00369 family)
VLALSGLEQMRLFVERGGPRPPISHLTGLIPVEFGEGHSVFEMPVSPWLASATGVLQGGMLLVLADAPLGSSIHTKLPPATTYTTSEISMYFLRPITSFGGKVRATGKAIHVGRSLALSEVSIADDEGRVIAHGSSRCFVFPPIDPPPVLPEEWDPLPDAVEDPPDPYVREPLGESLPQEVWDSMSGLEILRAQMAGELPPPPISQLTGIHPVDVEEGSATFAMPASEWLNSPTGMVQGGATAMLADLCLASAVLTTLPRATAFAPLDIKTNFLRPVTADGKDLTAHAKVLHRGRSLAVAEAEVLNAQGKRVMLASGTSQILPGRNASLA